MCFMPTPDKIKFLPKASPRMMVGIHVGYKFLPGCRWKGEHLVVPFRKYMNDTDGEFHFIKGAFDGELELYTNQSNKITQELQA